MKLLLIRHAEAEHNTRPFTVAGRALDSELTEVGHMQADNLARDLASLKIDYLIHSPALRCKQTADAIKRFQKKDIEIIEDDRVLEMSQGSSVGMNSLFVALSPVNIYELLKNKMDFSLPDGESFNEVADRMDAAIKEYEDFDGKNVVVISHGLAIRCFLARRSGWNVLRLLLKRVRNTQIIKWS